MKPGTSNRLHHLSKIPGSRHYVTRNNSHEMFCHLKHANVSRGRTRCIRYYIKCSKCRPFVWTQARISISIRQSPHQQQPAVCQTRPQSDVASVVFSNVSRVNSNWSSSTTCWEFFHQFVSVMTLKLIHTFFY